MYYRSTLLRNASLHAWKRSFSASSSLSLGPPPFEKLLIANRGEIACRIARTCKRLGIRTVALYSEADGKHALHAKLADESYLIGTGPSAQESYLRGSEILEICHVTGAQAIHPAYGFLSENAVFAQSVQDAGFVFVGPPPSAINIMGSKSHSKSIMEEAGVPTTPGYHGDNQDPQHLLEQAITNVGFPLLIKAVMGGGGKGMRLVQDKGQFLEALESCQRESLASFGDSSVLLEKYLVHPRHIEVQVMADHHGNVVHLHERDCSLQRRHQKIIEEAPASDLDMLVREKLGAMGTQAAKAVNYVNAGTVEFLVDIQSPNQQDFYFCEMNTRLQVEHPVTEMITGQDLVEWQLRIAAGEELPIKEQHNIPCIGHAFEARVYAENPLKEFLPATGNVWLHKPPAPDKSLMAKTLSGSSVRVDTGIQSGQDISVFYDPMISKLIVHGHDRTAALQKLISALKQYQLAGLPSNIDFLVKCAQHPVFQEAGGCNTGFLEHYMEGILDQIKVAPTQEYYAVAAFCMMLHAEKRVGIKDIEQSRRVVGNPWSSLSGSWRALDRVKRTLKVNGEEIAAECFCNSDGSFDISIVQEGSDDIPETFHVEGSTDMDGNLSLVVNGTKRVGFSSFLKKQKRDSILHLWSNDTSKDVYFAKIVFEDPLAGALSSDEGSGIGGSVMAPMPGKIVQVNAQVGDCVMKGDVLILMEAMKMQHSIRSPCDGIVVELSCSKDAIVNDGHVLAVVDAHVEKEDHVDAKAV